MANTIKKLPAILLAVIIAAALAFAVGATAQQAYAAEEYTGAFVFVYPQAEEYEGLPGETMGVYTTNWFEEELTPEQEASVSYQWSLGNGKEYATIEPDASDPSFAWIKFGEIPEEAESQDVEVNVTMLLEGKPVAQDYVNLTIDKDFYRINIGNFISEYATIGTTDELNVQLCHFTPENPDGAPVAATFSWEYTTKNVSVKSNGTEVKKTKIKAAAPEYSVPYAVTRKSKETDFFTLKATWKDSLGNKTDGYRYFAYFELPNDLSEFTIDTPLEATVGFGESYEVTAAVKYGDYILAGGEYSLKYYRYDGYDADTGEMIWTEVKSNELTVCPKGTEDQDGNDIGGTGLYRVQATAHPDSKFKGSTPETEGYINLYENHSLNGYRATVTTEENEYETQPGTVLHPIIKVDDTRLEIGKDCEVWYENQSTGDTFTEFPQEAGEYWFHVKGKDPYYGEDSLHYFKVGYPNDIFRVKGKTVKVKANKKTTIKASKAFNTKSYGNVYYYKEKGNKKISVNYNGKITVKKGLKKGTYKIKVSAFTMGDETHLYAETKKPVTVTIKVK